MIVREISWRWEKRNLLKMRLYTLSFRIKHIVELHTICIDIFEFEQEEEIGGVMVLILDGNSEIGAQLGRNLFYLIYLRHFI